MKLDNNEIVWRTKLDFESFYYAPEFFIMTDKTRIAFTTPYYKEPGTISAGLRYFATVDMKTGNIIPKKWGQFIRISTIAGLTHPGRYSISTIKK